MSRCAKSMLAVAAALAVVGASSCDKPTSGGSSGPAIVGGLDRVTLGTVHVYDLTPAGGSASTHTVQVIAASAGGFTRRSQTTGDTLYSETTYEIVDGGLFLTSSRNSTGTLVFDHSPGSVYLPPDVTPGATTTTVSAVTGTSSFAATREATVNGVESVTVPAGTYQALKVTMISSQSNAPVTFTNVVWWAPGVGRVKMVGYPTATPATTTTYELTSLTNAAPPAIGSLDGSYDTTAIRCNGTAAPSPIADLITGANSMSFLVAGSVGNITWSDATCSIVQPVGYAFPSAGNVTMTVAGPFGCFPDAGTCAALSTSTFGVGVCGQTDAQGARQYTFSPTSVSSGQTVDLLRVGGDECATLASSTDPISYVLTKQ